ncbi:MAG TPA: hypothetical protein H9888_05785 [Candidatus Rikenella faecigallinarum]|uniref:Uncharacterized protein n=1 Tax=Candidatus Rikenella faecigallinarum TaxID=2838745 RepID=A0A9D1TZ80_9BACT|nr:hypothetical protein [Candidatus Rikenella faecigallinarum]
MATIQRGTSPVPLVMGVLVFALGLPAALCATVCATAITVGTAGAGTGVGGFMVFMAFAAPVLGLIGGIMGKSNPVASGVLLLVAAFLLLIETISMFSVLALISFILAVIGGIMALVQTKETVEA